jgi:hypothetical protein
MFECPKNLVTKTDAVAAPVRGQASHRLASGATNLLEVGIGARRSRDESAGVRLGGLFRHHAGVALLDEAPVLQDGDPPAHVVAMHFTASVPLDGALCRQAVHTLDLAHTYVCQRIDLHSAQLVS